LCSPRFTNWTKTSSGANIKNIRVSELSEFQIPLPPLEEQKRIAAILDKADEIRKKRQQAIELADQFLKSVFLDMFGDPVTNPKGWEEVELSSLLKSKLQNGAYYPADQYSEAGTEMVHMSDAFYDVIQRGNLKRVNASSDDLLKYQLTSEDVLISRRSLTYDGAAKPCLIPDNEEPLIFESSMIRVTPNRDRILPKFLFHYLSDESVKRHRVRKYVTGATIKGISQKNLEIIGVLVPPLELQRRFTDFVTQFDSQIKAHESQALRLDELFASINRQAFNGKRDGIRGADCDL
jgi:type I restriction enzyme S subunit